MTFDDLGCHIGFETDIGTVTFQRESSSPLTLKYVMYIPILKKKLVLVAMLEDCGYYRTPKFSIFDNLPTLHPPSFLI